jgi:hypothetical protein
MRGRAEREQKVEREEKALGRGQVLNRKAERAAGNHVKRRVARDVNVCLLAS